MSLRFSYNSGTKSLYNAYSHPVCTTKWTMAHHWYKFICSHN